MSMNKRRTFTHNFSASMLMFAVLTGCVSAPKFEDAVRSHRAGDVVKSISALKQLAKDKHVGAQAYLGAVYGSGDGVPRNYRLAFQWQLKAAKQGHMLAQYNIGVLYSKGLGAGQNLQQAAFWFQQAAEAGLPKARLQMGLMRENGWGVARCPYEASNWYYLAGQGYLVEDNLKMAAHARDRIRKILPGYYLGSELSDEIFLYEPDKK